MAAQHRRTTGVRALAAISCLAALAGCEAKNRYVAPPPPAVSVARPTRRDVTTYAEYTGTTRAVASVDLRARVKGFLEKVNFKDGDDVKKGAVLFVIERAPYQIQLDNVEADLSKNKAALALADSEFRRNSQLFAQRSISPLDFEKYRSNFDAARAAVAASEASVADARLNLGYTEVRAPFDGRVGRRQVDPGNLVGDGQATVLGTVVQYNPIYAYVNVSERDLLRFRAMARDGARGDYRKGEVPMELGLLDESGYPHRGAVDFANIEVDEASGTIQARGSFENPGDVIIPGLFVRVRVPLEEIQGALLVPERALVSDPLGQALLVVGKDDVVEQRPVKTSGLEPGGLRVVVDGLKADDWVVVDGLQRARPGEKVNPKRPEAPARNVAAASR
ncbi:MAG TPA: efflux RND transporter periplasmic adaptor subunit [Isosphaeraceae bacterium]|nr:efflux RND transporter periplasmic adaptor subunit [Isosphaeraceae bacterium]